MIMNLLPSLRDINNKNCFFKTPIVIYIKNQWSEDIGEIETNID